MARLFLILLAIGGVLLAAGIAVFWLSRVRQRQPVRGAARGGGATGGRQARQGRGGGTAPAGRSNVPAQAAAGTPAGGAEAEDDEDDLLDLQNVEGRVQRSRVRKVGEVVNQHPEEAASVLKRWLHQDDQTD